MKKAQMIDPEKIIITLVLIVFGAIFVFLFKDWIFQNFAPVLIGIVLIGGPGYAIMSNPDLLHEKTFITIVSLLFIVGLGFMTFPFWKDIALSSGTLATNCDGECCSIADFTSKDSEFIQATAYGEGYISCDCRYTSEGVDESGGFIKNSNFCEVPNKHPGKTISGFRCAFAHAGESQALAWQRCNNVQTETTTSTTTMPVTTTTTTMPQGQTVQKSWFVIAWEWFLSLFY